MKFITACSKHWHINKKIMLKIGLWLLSSFFIVGFSAHLTAQALPPIHAHNDYYHDLPFWYAYSNGAQSIEVDVWLQNDSLYVAHDREEIQAGKTIERLYLSHLQTLVAQGESRPLQLLIDVKTEAYATLDKIVAVLRSYPAIVGAPHVRILISGNRPASADYPNYPSFILFDHQSLGDLEQINLDKVGLISLSFRRLSVWNGYGRMTAADQENVHQVIAKAKQFGKPIRFWATPDTKTAWAYFAYCGLAYINTDKPAEARLFLDQLPLRNQAKVPPVPVYEPQFPKWDIAQPRNIILLIGDGNGLAQITAGLIANRGALSMTQLKDIGLVITAAADDLVTDSAAGGTAIATGHKTNNRALGVDTSGRAVPSLVELLSLKGYQTAIVTTDAIYGATPAAFYAHQSERDDLYSTLEDLKNSPLSLFVAGGAERADVLGSHFRIADDLDELKDLARPTAVFLSEGKVPSADSIRLNHLKTAVGKTLRLLAAQGKPFFLLVEGAQIDNGGHANAISTIVNELQGFDLAVGEALRFADDNRETLVLITADHETGGLGISSPTTSGSSLRADFLSVDHTGIMVPLFAYGPASQLFRGVYDNTSIFRLVRSALGL